MVAPGKVWPWPPVPIAIFTNFVLSASDVMLEGVCKREAGSASESFTRQAKDAADTLPRKSLLDTIVTSLTSL
jgi:hypothetical protein